MNRVEIEAGNVEEAIETGLARLGTTRDRVDIEVLTEPTKGLLGFGTRKARVRLTEKPSARAAEAPAKPELASPPPSTGLAEEVSERSGSAVEEARRFLVEIVRRMGFDIGIDAEGGPDEPQLVMTGAVPGSLIGRRGRTLDALEYLVNRIVARDGTRAPRISVDAEGYRDRHRRSLEELARRMGSEARRRGRSVTLNPMSPRDRRIVHLALQDEPSLTTKSFGEGRYRKVRIIPQSGRGGRRQHRGGEPPA